MDQFVVRYIPGGMSLCHSGWWLCQHIDYNDGTSHDNPIKMLRVSDYK